MGVWNHRGSPVPDVHIPGPVFGALVTYAQEKTKSCFRVFGFRDKSRASNIGPSDI